MGTKILKVDIDEKLFDLLDNYVLGKKQDDRSVTKKKIVQEAILNFLNGSEVKFKKQKFKFKRSH